jgi:hypothetical protein
MRHQEIPLEDTFADVLRKAMRGAGVTENQLASATGIPAPTIGDWLKEKGAADDAQARELATVLRLDGGKLADSAAQRWSPPHIERPDIRRHPQDPQPSNGYVFFLEGGRQAALVDPAGLPQNLLRVLRDGDYPQARGSLRCHRGCRGGLPAGAHRHACAGRASHRFAREFRDAAP